MSDVIMTNITRHMIKPTYKDLVSGIFASTSERTGEDVKMCKFLFILSTPKDERHLFLAEFEHKYLVRYTGYFILHSIDSKISLCGMRIDV